MKKYFFFVVIFLIFSFILRGAEEITVSPSQIYVGTDITFQIINLTTDPSPPPSWNFNDGSPSKSGKTVHHFFKEAKTYNVRCSWDESGTPKEVTKSVTVMDNRTVSFDGSGFVAGMSVQFKTTNFKKPTLKWEFGDGMVKENGSKNEAHTYQNPGNYTVKVFGYSGTPPTPKTCNIDILPDNRSITINTSPVKARHKVDFTANNFSSSNLKWKFGDTVEKNGGQNMGHIYNNQGTYTVKVKDLSKPAFPEVKVQCNVQSDNRILNINPSNPSLYQEITFNAVNFSSSNLSWDFDDSTTITSGTTVKHSFSNMRRFVIKVKEAGSGNLPIEKEININRDMRKVEIMPYYIVVGQSATIKLVNSDANQVNWMIGPHEKKMNAPKTIQHQFYDPGNFEIVCQIQNQIPVKTRLNVRENRSISFSPKYLFEGAKITFDTRNFNAPNLKWDFGDGTILHAGKKHFHTYRSSGRFVVEVFDFGGQSKVPVQKPLNILRENREIKLRSQIIYKGSEIEMEAQNFKGYSIKWNFGDGMLKMGGKRVKHKYVRSGGIIISAIDFGGADTKKITKNIQIQLDNRKITYPSELIEGEGYDMRLENVSGGNFEWKFSDGDIKSGQSIPSKIFRYSGLHTITIYDRSWKYPPYEEKVTVKPDYRSVKASPPFALPDELIDFSALNFKGPVKWDFGDGTVVGQGLKNMKHKFKALGKYKVKAIDFGGGSSKVFSKTILVSEFTPNFKITHIEIAFSNGKYYRVVPRKSLPPSYYVKLKAVGRGIIKGRWILDDMTMGLFETILRENKVVHLKGAKIAKLPIIDPGIHNFSFDFTNYKFDREIPILRYFVTNSGAIKIKSPMSGSKISQQKPLKLKWYLKKKGANYEVSISTVPLQFLRDDLIKWIKVGEKMEFDVDLSSYKTGTWIYWYVREVDNAGDVLTTSEVSSFKIVK